MTEQAAPAQDELRAWRRIEERWKALGKEMTQANRPAREIKAIRFLGHILQEQQDTTIAPTRLLTPQGYACLYHSMHGAIAYTRFVDLNRQQRSDAMPCHCSHGVDCLQSHPNAHPLRQNAIPRMGNFRAGRYQGEWGC